jgi:HEAT repeat protein
MASDRVERQLANLKAIRAAGQTEAGLKDLRKALGDRVNVVVAKAAGIAGEWQARVLLPDLLAAFDRLFVKAAETDPQCGGKNELSKCLKELGFAESAVYLRGLQHHQWESNWGGKSDTAGVLRSTCALALVQCTDIPRHETLLHLVQALTEEDANVRVDAARAMEQMGGREVALLLRLKARAGDKEVRVSGQVLESLVHVEGASGVAFVAEFLGHADEEIREEAALALGASRLPEAVAALQNAYEKSSFLRGGPALLRAISASRLDAALEFLLELVRSARLHEADEALRALELHRDSEEIVMRIAEAVSSREELRSLFRDLYSSKA